MLSLIMYLITRKHAPPPTAEDLAREDELYEGMPGI